MLLRSQTWRELRRLFNELPAKRVRLLVIVLIASFLQGLMDVVLVGMMTRLAGLMAVADCKISCQVFVCLVWSS